MAKQLGNRWCIAGTLAAMALPALMMVAGCAGKREMTDLWKDPSFRSGPLKNVLVVALRKDPVRRRMWEDAFAEELGTRGVTATSSYQLYQGAPPDTQEVIEAVRKNDFDAVLVSIQLPDQTTSTYVAGTVRREMVTTQDYLGFFHTYWSNVQDPGYIEIDEIARFQTDVWATDGSGRLIWSGTMRTFESVSTHSMEKAVSKEIVPALETEGLVPKTK